MNRITKIVVLTIFITIGVIVGGYLIIGYWICFQLDNKSSSCYLTPPWLTEQTTFETEEECKRLTGASSCGYVTCDYIPEGKSFEEVCGKNFQNGWTPSKN